jgi:hypothetical protein
MMLPDVAAASIRRTIPVERPYRRARRSENATAWQVLGHGLPPSRAVAGKRHIAVHTNNFAIAWHNGQYRQRSLRLDEAVTIYRRALSSTPTCLKPEQPR